MIQVMLAAAVVIIVVLMFVTVTAPRDSDEGYEEYEEDGWSQAVYDVIEERLGQIHREGFSPSMDDTYTDDQLTWAAVMYALAEHQQGNPPRRWPWDDAWWKPTTRRRNLVKAAALIIAEIERMDRLDEATEEV